jgi:hypothetical protein
MIDLERDQEDNYQSALARRRAIEKAWKGLGSPLTAEGSRGQEVEHPLVEMLRLHDALIAKLALPLRKAHAGPEPSAVVRTGRITRLEAVPKPKAKKAPPLTHSRQASAEPR